MRLRGRLEIELGRRKFLVVLFKGSIEGRKRGLGGIVMPAMFAGPGELRNVKPARRARFIHSRRRGKRRTTEKSGKSVQMRALDQRWYGGIRHRTDKIVSVMIFGDAVRRSQASVVRFDETPLW